MNQCFTARPAALQSAVLPLQNLSAQVTWRMMLLGLGIGFALFLPELALRKTVEA